jgi:hypothetical protein
MQRNALTQQDLPLHLFEIIYYRGVMLDSFGKPSFYEQVTDVKLLFLLSFIGLLLLLLVRLRRMLFSTEFLFALC